MGLSGRSEEDYNVKRLAMDLHVRRQLFLLLDDNYFSRSTTTTL
jgi:hypothetical protein